MLSFEQQGPTEVLYDNISAIKLSKNLILHGRSKHICVRYHFLCDFCKDGVIDVVHCKSEDQIANILIKPIKTVAFLKLRNVLGMCSKKEVGGNEEELGCWSFLCKLSVFQTSV